MSWMFYTNTDVWTELERAPVRVWEMVCSLGLVNRRSNASIVDRGHGKSIVRKSCNPSTEYQWQLADQSQKWLLHMNQVSSTQSPVIGPGWNFRGWRRSRLRWRSFWTYWSFVRGRHASILQCAGSIFLKLHQGVRWMCRACWRSDVKQ